MQHKDFLRLILALVVTAAGLSADVFCSPTLAADASQNPGTGELTKPDLAATEISESGDYKLTWSDEFNERGPLNPNDWTFERGFVRGHELQWYQSDNARCENGLLVITARREHVKNARYDSNSSDWRLNREYADYTSASLTTAGCTNGNMVDL